MANREKAPQLFADELKAVLNTLRTDADATRQRYSGQANATVWRLLMPKTRHHIYYRRDEHAAVVTILLVANAISETGPAL
jgi:hypothetical protein